MRSRLTWINLTLRAVMETGIVLAFAYWVYRTGQTGGAKALLAVGAPVIGFGIWGAVDFHNVGRRAESLRLIEELAISGLAAFALYAAGQPALGIALGAVSIVYHALVHVSGARLLKH